MSYKNPYSKARVSDDWASHRARGSLGGIDYAVPVGTPIYAPAQGRIENVKGNGSGGWYVRLHHESPGLGLGWTDEFLHLSKFMKPGHYKQGDIIGYSGGAVGHPGAGASTGAHIHWHLINPQGVRVNPLNYFDGVKRSAEADTHATAGPTTNVDWMKLQKFLKSKYGYKGVIDGSPGHGTWLATQQWLRKEHGYTGACDGEPGPMTFASLSKAAIKAKFTK